MEEAKRLPYPKSVLFIFVHQIFERFSFWGIVVILPLFLRNVLHFNDDSATAIYHGFTIFGYLSSFVGAIVADSFFGKFRTIIGFSFAYFIGTFLLTASATPLMSTGLTLGAAITGLVLTALASGSIKPCIIAYGGDQFNLPQQQKQLDTYFPILYLIINFSLFFTAIITPILRKDISCFGNDSCYSMAFVVPFVLVIIAFVIFIIGRKFYKNNPVEENVIVKAFGCIRTALIEKFKSDDDKRRENWLDFADKKFDQKFINDVKTVLNLFVLFVPVTLFWALFDQQFSRWTFQATRMDNNAFGYSIKPDQFATLNFVLTFMFIPLFEKIVYPVLAKFKLLKKPLQRVVVGAICASLAFVICACVELKIESTLQEFSVSQLNLINGLPCSVNIEIINKKLQNSNEVILANTTIPKFQNEILKDLPTGLVSVNVNIQRDVTKTECDDLIPTRHDLEISSQKAYSALIYKRELSTGIGIVTTEDEPDDLQKSLESNSKVRVIYAGLTRGSSTLSFVPSTGDVIELNLNSDSGYSTTKEIPPDNYEIKICDQNSKDQIAEQNLISIKTFVGGNYIVSITGNNPGNENSSSIEYTTNMYTLIEPNSVHIFWLIPQYMVMSIAEVMVEVSLTGYAYSQAPKNMKSLLQVVNLIPPALGGILVVFIAEAKFFQKQSLEFFLFAGINFGAVLLLIFLSLQYKPVRISEETEDDESLKRIQGVDNPSFQD